MLQSNNNYVKKPEVEIQFFRIRGNTWDLIICSSMFRIHLRPTIQVYLIFFAIECRIHIDLHLLGGRYGAQHKREQVNYVDTQKQVCFYDFVKFI